MVRPSLSRYTDPTRSSTGQKLPRSSCRLRRNASRTPRPSIFTSGAASTNQAKNTSPGTMKRDSPTPSPSENSNEVAISGRYGVVRITVTRDGRSLPTIDCATTAITTPA